MKKLLIVLTTALLSLNAFAVHHSVMENYDLLTPANKALADQGKILRVVVVNKVPGSVQDSGVGVSAQPLVVQESCFATLSVDSDNTVTTGGTAGSCGGEGTPAVTSVVSSNIAVDIDFETFYSYDLTNVQVVLYAQDIYTSVFTELVNDAFTVESDDLGNGATTVIYVVDAAYAQDYDISADVFLDDERGTACEIETNAVVL